MPIQQNLLSFLKIWTHFSKREERVGVSLVMCTVLIMLLPRWLRMYKQENDPNAFALELIPEAKNKIAFKQYGKGYPHNYKHEDYKHSDYKHPENNPSEHKHSDYKYSNDKNSNNNHEDHKHKNADNFNKNSDYSKKWNNRNTENLNSKTTNKSVDKINMQTADAETWASLKGIGPVLSTRIIKYRDLLGGFYSHEQIKEVYGVSEETYAMIQGQLILSKDATKEKGLTKLDLEKLDFKTCLKHPYIGYDGAKAIDTWRKNHEDGEEISKEDLIQILGPEKAKKISPYLR